MDLEGNPAFGVELQSIDFAAFARACRAAGYTVTVPDEAETVLREALVRGQEDRWDILKTVAENTIQEVVGAAADPPQAAGVIACGEKLTCKRP